MAAQRRMDRHSPNPTAPRPHVRLSVPVTPEVHARLAALAILRGVERSELAASFVAAGVKHVVIQERGGDADGGDPAVGPAGL